MEFALSEGDLASVSWALTSIVGEEALNDLYSFHVTATLLESVVQSISTPGRAIAESVIGCACWLELHKADVRRYGVVASVEVDPGNDGSHAVVFRMVVKPRAWLLTLRKNTRIFQGRYVHQIVSEVLSESSVCHRWLLKNKYLKRVYCTQYEETDYAFVSRILAEEGVFWYFDHIEELNSTAAPTDPEGTTLETVASVASLVGKIADGFVDSEFVKSDAAQGTIGTVGSLSSIVGDMGTFAKDPEADDPIWGSIGSVRPPKAQLPSEVFVFGDTTFGYDDGAQTNDSPRGDSSGGLTLRYDSGTTHFASDVVTAFSGARTVAPRAVELRDYDFRRPMALLSKRNQVKSEVALLEAPLEFYEHHGEYEKPDIDDEQVGIRIEQLRADATIIRGQSTCPRMMPGFSLELTQAPTFFQDGRFVPTKVIHEAYVADVSGKPGSVEQVADTLASVLREYQARNRMLGEGEIRELARTAAANTTVPKVYQNRFEWVSSDVVYRPPLPERIRHAVNESAVVVGPAGQAIYADHYGRVKVQFHWDRSGKYNEASSCWVRVLSTWAGAGYGFQFFPRVGMEVVVTFLGGDPDRPVISGTVYNATHPTPEPLPQRLTRSGLRSQTVPGGGGFNEFSFEDAKGVERVFIHAQKDLHEIVNDAHTTTVRGAQTTTVGGNQSIGVAAERIVGVGGNAAELVGKNKSAQVGGDRSERVAKNSSELVHGDSVREVRGVSVTETRSDDLEIVRGDKNLTVHGRHVVQVVRKHDGPKGSSFTYVDGSSYHTATDRVVIRAEPSVGEADNSCIRLECGDTYLELTKDKIALSAKAVTIAASDSFTVSSGSVEIAGSDHIKLSRDSAAIELTADGFAVGGVSKIELATSSAKLLLDGGTAEILASGTASVKGSSVKLKSGSASDSKSTSSTSDSAQPTTKHLKLLFCHPHKSNLAEPIKNTKYRLTTDNFVCEEKTDVDGVIDVEVPIGTTAATVVLFVNELEPFKPRYPAPLVWQIHIEADFCTAQDVKGARLRLRNLGYAPGTDLAIDKLEDDPLTAKAIEEFQRDQRIRVSGKLDEDSTSTSLDTVYGTVQ